MDDDAHNGAESDGRVPTRVLDESARTRVDSPSETDAPERAQPRETVALRDAVALCDAEEGATLGRYRLLDVLGTGGLGVVYRALDPALDREVAIKLLQRRPESVGMDVARLRREAAALAQLAHPNVVQVYDIGVYGRQGSTRTRGHGTYLVMALVGGDELTAWLKTGPTPAAIVDAFVQAGRGLAAAHAEGIVHRDFKPANAIVRHDGVVKVLDFGLARRQESTSFDGDVSVSAMSNDALPLLDTPLTVAGTVMGTPLYMAPEQHQGATPDARGDQYSFCLALAESLHGERLVAGTTMHKLAIAKSKLRLDPSEHRIDARLCRVLARGLAFDPRKRYASMDDLLAAIDASQRPGALRRTTVGLSVLALAGVGVWWVTRQPESDIPSAANQVTEPFEDYGPYIKACATGASLVEATAGAEALRSYARLLRQQARRDGDMALSAWTWFWETKSWDVVEQAATVIPLETSAFYEAQEAGVDFVAAYAAADLAFSTSTLGDPSWETWIRHARAVVDRGGLSPQDAATVVGNLGLAYAATGDMATASVFFREAVDDLAAADGPSSKHLDWPLNNLAASLWRVGRLQDALIWAERAKRLRAQWYDPDAAEVAISSTVVGSILMESGYPIEALSHFERAHAVLKQPGVAPPQQRLGSFQNLAEVCVALGRLDEAIAMQEHTVQEFAALESDYTMPWVESALYLARWYRQAGRFADARRVYTELTASEDTNEFTTGLIAEARDELAALPSTE